MAQRRRRVFIVGFLSDNNKKFHYPKTVRKKLEVKDFLDNKVDASFTISDKLWKGHINRKKRNKDNGKGFGYKLTIRLTNAQILFLLDTIKMEVNV